MAGLLSGIAQGGMMGMAGKRRKDAKDKAAARKDQRDTMANLDSIDAKNTAGLEAGDYGQMSPEERQAEHDVQLADGGKVQGYKRGGMIGKGKKAGSRVGSGPAEIGYADGGSLGVTYAEKPKQETMGGVSGKKVENRNAGKRQHTAPMIGVRADATAPDIRTEVQMAEHNPDNTLKLADGGAILGYATGGILNGNSLPGGYVQHGSMTQTSDPLWHMECHRDFGKKG